MNPYPRPLGAPVYDAQSPLGKLISPNQRGKLVTLGPPPIGAPDAEGRLFGHSITGFDLVSGIDCVVGEWAEVSLGVRLSPTMQPRTAEDFLTALPVVVQLRAIVTYGLGSAPLQFECDWIQGTGFPISADTLGIEARYILQTDPGQPFPDWQAPTFDLSAGVGRGGETPNSNSCRLTEIRYLAPEQDKLVRIPPKAISVVAVPLAQSGSVTLELRAYGAPYTETYTVTAPLAGYQVENSVPIWNGAEFVRIGNPDSQTPLRVAVIFGLKP